MLKLMLKRIMFGIVTIVALFSLTAFKWVSASTIVELTPEQYEARLNNTLKSTQVYDDFSAIINHYFSLFTFDELGYEKVSGVNNYRILEITTNLDDGNNKISDLERQLKLIKNIFSRQIANQNLSGNYFIQNLPNFTLEVMTIKEFNSYRGELIGKYDAIVFTTGTYINDTINEVEFELVKYPVSPNDSLTGGSYVKIYYDEAKTKLKYEGSMKNGVYHGWGRLFYENGNLQYEGDFNEGVYHNWGRLFSENNVLIYEGGYKNGFFQGYGKHFTESGKLIYEGHYQDGIYHGYGTLYDENGLIIYSGSWKLGVYHGNGKLYYPNSHVIQYNGDFANGKRNGQGNVYSDRGILLYTGKWLNNMREGYGTSFYANGSWEYTGYWHQNQKINDKPYQRLNDITEYKANEVLDFMSKNLPVFFHIDTIIDTNSNFFYYFGSNNSDVYRINYTSDEIPFFNLLAIMGITELLVDKPTIRINSQPVDYYANPNISYQVNDELTFRFSLLNKDYATLKFYLDINQNNEIEDHEIAAIQDITYGDNTFSFRVPNVINGLLKYHLAIESDDYVSIYQGTLNIKQGAVPTIKVLSLFIDTNNILYTENASYFINNGAYKLEFTSCSIKNFDKKNDECSYSKVLDQHDVVFLGQDVFYNNGNRDGYAALRTAIQNGKPVIFTSSFTNGSHQWFADFSSYIGISAYRSDSSILNQANRLQIMNQYSYIAYPFNLNTANLSIPNGVNYTFNEKFRLNLNNEDVIPLLNMYEVNSQSIDRYDSYNYYYYTKKDNVIYINLGGNPTRKYTQLEHQMMANAIINSYIEAESTGRTIGDIEYVITVNNFKNTIVNIDDTVSFKFTLFKSLLQDTDSFAYSLMVGGVKVADDVPIIANESYTLDITSYLPKPNKNKVEAVDVSLTVTNRRGTNHQYSFTVFVADLDGYAITLNRELLLNNTYGQFAEINKTYNLKYTLLLGNLDFSDVKQKDKLPTQIILKNVNINDVFNEGVLIMDGELNPTIENGQSSFSKELADIVYNLHNNQYVPAKKTIELSVPISFTSTGYHDLMNATLTFKGVGGDEETLTFTHIKDVKALYKINDPNMVNLSFNGDTTFIEYSDVDKHFIKDLVRIDGEKTHVVKVKLNNTVINYAEHYFIPNARGMFNYTLYITDVFDQTIEVKLNLIVYESINSINLKHLDIKLGESAYLDLQLSPDRSLENVLITFNQSNDDKVVDYQIVDNKVLITGVELGYVKVTVKGYDPTGKEIIEEAIITVYGPIKVVDQKHQYVVTEGKTINFPSYEIHPDYAGFEVRFASTNDAVVTVDENGVITAVGLGRAIVEAYLIDQDGNPIKGRVAILVIVTDKLSQNSGFKQDIINQIIPIYTEYEYNLEDFIEIIPNDAENVTLVFPIEEQENLVLRDGKYVTFMDAGEYRLRVIITQILDDETIVVEKEATITVHVPNPDIKM